MKKIVLSVTAVVASFVAGCTASTSDPETGSSTSELSASWQKVLTCDDGAAVVDVDTNERRHLQLVIRNPQIIGYLASQVRVSTQGIVAPSGEIIVDGRQDHGVWWAGDFQWMNGAVPYVNVDVRREWGGARVSFWVNGQGGQGCYCRSGGDPCSGSLCECPSGPEDLVCPGNPRHELANWFFQRCN